MRNVKIEPAVSSEMCYFGDNLHLSKLGLKQPEMARDLFSGLLAPLNFPGDGLRNSPNRLIRPDCYLPIALVLSWDHLWVNDSLCHWTPRG